MRDQQQVNTPEKKMAEMERGMKMIETTAETEIGSAALCNVTNSVYLCQVQHADHHSASDGSR